jgi:hypothetical protein
MGQGHLFRMDFAEIALQRKLGADIVAAVRSQGRTPEYFWLCQKCVSSMTVEMSDTGQTFLALLKAPAPKRAEGTAQVFATRRAAAS